MAPADLALGLITEERLDPGLTKHYEGAFTQGSGSLHVRGSHEEGLAAAPQDESYARLPANVTLEQPRHPRSKVGTYVPGITGLHPLLREELVNLPWFLDLRFSADGEALDMDRCVIEGYRRQLDLRDAVLRRRFTWKTRSGAVLEASYMRYVSRARERICVQEVEYRCVSGRCTLRIEAGIDARVKTNGHDHFTVVEPHTDGGRSEVVVTTDTGDVVAVCSEVRAARAAFRPRGGLDRRPSCGADVSLGAGDAVEMLKISAVTTSRDRGLLKAPRPAVSELVQSAFAEHAALYREHAALWEEMWRASAVRIEGDERSQRAVSFALYHLLRAGNPADPRVPICAKGWAGEAYFGHFFWDTEIYLLPFYAYTRPDVARSLLEFRLGTLDGARRNAAAMGYRGARYPWESSVTGDEQCPNWQYADHEVHVTADIAHGIRHYAAATADRNLPARAAEMLVETGRYWVSRVERKPDGSVNLNGVMGPDEYTCFTDNNAYTNDMVRRALAFTLDTLRELAAERPRESAELRERLAVSDAELAEMKRVAAALPVRQRADGVIIQCDHFEDLEDVDFAAVWKDRSRPLGRAVTQERMYRSKCLKQADALMLCYLFPSAWTDKVTAATYDYYEPLTTHDSSLSCVIHSILAARMGRAREAWDFFSRSLDIDLDGGAGGAAEGIHIANCGGIWQAVVMGFGGMQWAYEGGAPDGGGADSGGADSAPPRFQPRLPAHWKSLEFPVSWRGARYTVCMTREGVSVKPAAETASGAA